MIFLSDADAEQSVQQTSLVLHPFITDNQNYIMSYSSPLDKTCIKKFILSSLPKKHTECKHQMMANALCLLSVSAWLMEDVPGGGVCTEACFLSPLWLFTPDIIDNFYCDTKLLLQYLHYWNVQTFLSQAQTKHSLPTYKQQFNPYTQQKSSDPIHSGTYIPLPQWKFVLPLVYRYIQHKPRRKKCCHHYTLPSSGIEKKTNVSHRTPHTTISNTTISTITTTITTTHQQ